MIVETAEVLSIANDKIKIRIARQAGCSCCKNKDLCGAKDGEFELDSAYLDLRPGDRIEVGIDEKWSLLAAVLMFIVPCLIFVFSLWYLRAMGEAGSFFLAAGAVFGYYCLVRIALKRRGSRFNLRILKKL